jgi:tetratricopeptide (TPR) repeat protein
VRVSGDPWQLAILTSTRADVAVVRGDYERAEALLTEALASSTTLRLGHGIVQLTTSLADLSILRGDPTHALDLLDDARRRAVSVGAREMLAQVGTATGLALHRLGRPLDAAAAYRNALDHLQPGFKSGESLILCRLADVDLDLGDHAAARAHLARALDLVGVSADRLRSTALALEGWAALLLAEGRPARAARALGSAEQLRADAGAPLADGERMSIDRVRCALEHELGATALADALAAAASIPVAEIVDELAGADGRVAT